MSEVVCGFLQNDILDRVILLDRLVQNSASGIRGAWLTVFFKKLPTWARRCG